MNLSFAMNTKYDEYDSDIPFWQAMRPTLCCLARIYLAAPYGSKLPPCSHLGSSPARFSASALLASWMPPCSHLAGDWGELDAGERGLPRLPAGDSGRARRRRARTAALARQGLGASSTPASEVGRACQPGTRGELDDGERGRPRLAAGDSGLARRR